MKYLLFVLTALVFLFNQSITLSQTFTKIIQGSFVNDGGASRSVNFVDYDNDGDLDLYVSNGKRYGQRSFFYQNNGGTFTRLFNIGPVNDSLPFDGSSWGDFDNDGSIDFCTVTWYDSVSVLYKNNGAGNFTFLNTSPIVTNRGFSETCSWGDYDNDGLVDLIVTNTKPTNSRNRLYRNLGNGNFASVDSGVVYNDVGYFSRGVNWVDIDGDRDLDLFICNEEGGNELMYQNNGNGYFTKIINIAPTTSGGNSWSSSWGDYDNDGDLDLFVANWGNQKNNLFRNDGNFNFTAVTNDTIVNDPGNYSCTGWGDYDNDGDLDMFVTQAYKTPNAPMKNNLYKNKLIETGTASFEKITAGDIVNDAGYSYGFAWADWDADGDLDLFTARTYNESENNSAFLNDGNSNKWLEIKLTGTTSNKSAIGSKVRIKAVINGVSRWLMRDAAAQSGYCGENLDLHFGLGDAAVIDSIKIEWPSGATQHFTNVNTNQIIRIVEGQGIIGIHQNEGKIPEKFNLYQNYPNPFNPSTTIKFDIPASQNVNVIVFDVTGRLVCKLFEGFLSAGSYETEWNGNGVSSGIYFCRLETNTGSMTRKMLLVK
jgi:enediyne biosynthesis protein E4